MKYYLLAFFLFFFKTGFSQTIDTTALNTLRDAVLELQNSELMRSGTLAINIRNVKDRSTVFGLNQGMSLPSASTLKLVSTATALAVFGGDYKFQTFLEHDGVIRGDTLVGNLYIHGLGDPALGSDRFAGYLKSTELLSRWTAAVKKTGIKYIKGKIIGDASFFDSGTIASTWIWGDIGNYYGAGVWGLNFNENLYRVKFRPGAEPGDPAPVIGTDPIIPYLSFTNRVTSGERGSGDKTIIYSSPFGTDVVLTGTVPVGQATFTVKGSIPNPPEYAAFALREYMKAAAIIVSEPAPAVVTNVSGSLKPRIILDEYKSPPLRDICQQTNFWSVNLFADTFLKHTGKRLTGKTDFDNAALAVSNYWLGKGADLRGFYIKDGSGLSPSGAITAASLTDILSLASKESSFNDFYKSIAILGLNGTVRNLAKGTRAAGNMHVKSGSIENTRAFAGYFTAKSGALMSFTLIANKYQPGSQRIISEDLVKLMTLMAQL